MTSNLEYGAVWEHVLSKGLTSSWSAYASVSVHLDKPMLEYIYQIWPTLQGVNNKYIRASLIMAILWPTRKVIPIDAKPIAEKFIQLAQEDDDEYIRAVANVGVDRLSKGTFDINIGKMGETFVATYEELKRTLKSVDYKFYPDELAYLNTKALKTISKDSPEKIAQKSDVLLKIRDDHKIPAEQERLESYGIKRESTSTSSRTSITPIATNFPLSVSPSPSPTADVDSLAWMRRGRTELKDYAYGTRRSSAQTTMKKGFERTKKVQMMDFDEIKRQQEAEFRAQQVEADAKKAEKERKEAERERKARERETQRLERERRREEEERRREELRRRRQQEEEASSSAVAGPSTRASRSKAIAAAAISTSGPSRTQEQPDRKRRLNAGPNVTGKRLKTDLPSPEPMTGVSVDTGMAMRATPEMASPVSMGAPEPQQAGSSSSSVDVQRAEETANDLIGSHSISQEERQTLLNFLLGNFVIHQESRRIELSSEPLPDGSGRRITFILLEYDSGKYSVKRVAKKKGKKPLN